MRTKLITVPTPRLPVKPSPGFAKKHLATYKLDLLGLCAFGCRYCSSNSGNYLRIHRKEFADLTEAQTGSRTLPSSDASLSFVWEDVLLNLERQLDDVPSYALLEPASWTRRAA